VKSSIRPRPWLPPKSAFTGFRFPADVIVVAVRWYLRFNLSYRDVEELLVERGIEVDHVTVYRWVQRFTPLLADAARFCRHSPGEVLIQLGVNADNVERAKSFGGWQADIPALRALHPGLMDFDTWLTREGNAKFSTLFAQSSRR
jgi:hypothetical protein